MPDILIRGMEMPKGCGVCPLNTGAYYCAGLKRYVVEKEHVWMGSNYRRLKDCPLVELPPHGDLIDREWLKEVAYSKVNDFGGAFVDTLDLAIAPVIIPADKEGIK